MENMRCKKCARLSVVRCGDCGKQAKAEMIVGDTAECVDSYASGQILKSKGVFGQRLSLREFKPATFGSVS